MSQPNQDIFFALLRAAIWTDADGQPVGERLQEVSSLIDGSLVACHQSSFDWSSLLRSYEDHALLGVVAHAIMSLPVDKQPTPQQVTCLYDHVAQLVRGRYDQQQIIAEVFSLLREAGIHTILLKGEGLAVLYPNTSLRAVGDIDILVPHDRYEQAVHILQNISEDAGREDYLERHYQLTVQGTTIEIHHHPGWAANGAYESAFQTLSDHYLQPLTSNPSPITPNLSPLTSNPHYNALYVFNHLLHHMHDGGVGLRQFVDWALVLSANADAIDRNQLQMDLRATGLLRPWQIMGGILVKELGLPVDFFPLYDERLACKSQGKYLRRLLDGGNFGQQLRSPKDPRVPAPVRIFRNFVGTLRQTAFLWTLFPSGALAFAHNTFRTTLRHHAGQLHDKHF